MDYNYLAMDLGGQSIVSKEALIDREYQDVFPFGFQGNYAFAVNADWKPFNLSQTGEIPSDAQLLTITGLGTDGTRTEVRLNGVLVASAAVFTNITADISAFAGESATLEIKMYLERISSFGYSVGLDVISFAPPPGLSVSRAGDQLTLGWPVTLSGFVVQASDELAPSATWQALTNRVQVIGDQYSTSVQTEGQARFYRLEFAPAKPGG